MWHLLYIAYSHQATTAEEPQHRYLHNACWIKTFKVFFLFFLPIIRLYRRLNESCFSTVKLWEKTKEDLFSALLTHQNQLLSTTATSLYNWIKLCIVTLFILRSRVHRQERKWAVVHLQSLKSRDPFLMVEGETSWRLQTEISQFSISVLPFPPLCLLRATRSVHRLSAWWKRHPRLPAWRRWSGCSGIWHRSCTSLTGWTGCWPWSPELQGREEKSVEPEIKPCEQDAWRQKQDVRRVALINQSIWMYQRGPLLSAAPPLC